jgi:hypothetical protein
LNLGYTIRRKVTIGASKKGIYLQQSDSKDGREIAGIVDSNNLDETVQVRVINNDTDLPLSNIDRESSILHEPEKNKYYKFFVYLGKQLSTITVKAGIHAFKETSETTLADPLIQTDNSYFRIKLPENLENGIYRIPGFRIFRVRY